MSDWTQQQRKVDCYHLPYHNCGFSEMLLFRCVVFHFFPAVFALLVFSVPDSLLM